MLLSTPAYFTFLIAIFFAYWLVARFRLAGLAVIVFANYFFYARWDLVYLAVIPVASSCDFLIGKALAAAERPGVRRALVTLSIALNIGLIASVKYMPGLPWILPLGLSFYAFQSLTYTIDIYRRDAEPAESYLAYLASASFFPTTLAGPITRISTLLPQWSKRELLSPQDSGKAFFLIGLGLLKKFLIADYLAENLVNRVFDLPNLYSGTEVLLGVYGYALQLYYDFSGYTDIAIGSALLLGIKLPINFNRPYTAQNIADFWRRWHISFSNWLRDYVYFSLPGLRSRWKIFTYANLVITMAIGGLWHGANWTFLIWGLWHGTGLAAQRWWQVLRGNPKPSANFAIHFLKGLVTFHFVLIGWIFFRAANIATAREILTQIGSGTVSFANVAPGFLLVLGIAVIAHYLPKSWYDGSLRLYSASPFYAQAAAMALLIVAIQYIGATGAVPFIYNKF
ncbi:MAG TPA: MBOAT family O-acyltransferase [Bryobacteraceae bacterium]|nr:MBOAT family O-acyltransferase [Bryobacteraceae bacterium]